MCYCFQSIHGQNSVKLDVNQSQWFQSQLPFISYRSNFEPVFNNSLSFSGWPYLIRNNTEVSNFMVEKGMFCDFFLRIFVKSEWWLNFASFELWRLNFHHPPFLTCNKYSKSFGTLRLEFQLYLLFTGTQRSLDISEFSVYSTWILGMFENLSFKCKTANRTLCRTVPKFRSNFYVCQSQSQSPYSCFPTHWEINL